MPRSGPSFVRLLAAALLAAVFVLAAVAPTPVLEAHGLANASRPLPPLWGVSEEISAIRAQLDEAGARALEIQEQIDALEADKRALTERLAITAERVAAQREEVALAEARLAEAQAQFQERLVELYKRDRAGLLSVLLESESVPDLLARADVLERIAQNDEQIVSELNIAAADARFKQAQLEDLLEQDRALKHELDARHEQLDASLAEQEQIIAKLTADEHDALARARQIAESAAQQWRQSSVPADASVDQATASVDTHPGVEFLVSAYMPKHYRSTGQAFTAVCSWYGPGFHGRNTASGQVFNQYDLTCASKTLPFGTVLALSRGDRHVIVYVNDRGPYVAGRDLDLSKAAAQALGFTGVEAVHVEVLSPAR